MYKVDADKARRIIFCLMPQRIVVNHHPWIDGREFIEEFKSEGYNIISLASSSWERVARVWKDTRTPLLVEGSFTLEELREHFAESIYAYVYLYPNSAKTLALHGLKAGVKQSELSQIISSENEKNLATYKQHCEEFEDKVFTVLL
jgi:hypothetical protein